MNRNAIEFPQMVQHMLNQSSVNEYFNHFINFKNIYKGS